MQLPPAQLSLEQYLSLRIENKDLMIIPQKELDSLKRLMASGRNVGGELKIQEISDGILFFTGNEMSKRTYWAATGVVSGRVLIFIMKHETSTIFSPNATIQKLCKRGINFGVELHPN